MIATIGISTLCIIGSNLDLEKSELLYRFDTFDPADWTKVCGTPKWEVSGNSITGGGPDEPRHGQIFYREPVVGDIVMEFDAEIVSPSYHDLVWMYAVRFDDPKKPWSAGYLGCLQGWWGDFAGIEKLPDYKLSAIHAWDRCEPGRKYHIVSGMAKGVHFIFVDGKLVTRMEDHDLPNPGKPAYFGFGIYQSHCRYSNLKVYRPKLTRAPSRYVPGTKRTTVKK